jgi:hypothetical protein
MPATNVGWHHIHELVIPAILSLSKDRDLSSTVCYCNEEGCWASQHDTSGILHDNNW